MLRILCACFVLLVLCGRSLAHEQVVMGSDGRLYAVRIVRTPPVVTERTVITTTYAAPVRLAPAYAAPAYAAARPPILLRRAPAMGYDANTVAAIRAERRAKVGGALLKVGLSAALLMAFR